MILLHLDSCQTPISEVGATISVYPDIGPDIGADFEDIRYRSSSDIGVPPISGHVISECTRYRVYSDICTYMDIGVLDIGYTPISHVLISEEL